MLPVPVPVPVLVLVIEQEFERIQHAPGQVFGGLGPSPFFGLGLLEVGQYGFSFRGCGEPVEERQVKFFDHIIIIGRFAD